jgi:2-polyprenyl-6-hydroxyphenyl methylase/3-demethylubiquinone-9 3-methyltransferase
MKIIDNDYDSIAHLWWSEEEGSTASLKYLMNPVRFNYFNKWIGVHYKSGFRNIKALDVGCGGGLLSEELSKIGLKVTGVDPSKKSIIIAREHAKRDGLNIEYQEAYGEQLPFAEGQFDLLFCCDVLEHVKDVRKVISEISRVLKKGGLFFFDTVNRTFISRMAVIYFMQKCRFTSFVKANAHVWDMFIKPKELESILSQNDISINDLKGITPKQKRLSLIVDLHKVSRKKISYQELANRMNLIESEDLQCSYMGYGVKG